VPPSVETFHFEDAFDIDCGAFVLHEEVVTDIRVTTFFDKAGNPDHLIVHERFRGFIETPDGRLEADPGNGKAWKASKHCRLSSADAAVPVGSQLLVGARP
jgi:hypothetical protein